MSNPLKKCCQWPGCEKLVPPKFWACDKHWFRLPVGIREDIEALYDPDEPPTDGYRTAVNAALVWDREFSSTIRK